MADLPRASFPLFLVAFAPALLVAQAPSLRVQSTATPSQSIATLLVGAPLAGFATYVDATGPRGTLLGEPFWLGGTGALALLDTGTLDVLGARARAFATPANPALVGQPVFFQSFVLDATSQNGSFRASNGESMVLHNRTSAITFAFRDALSEGITGDADFSVPGRILAAPVQRRTVTIEPASGYPFGQPVATPLLNRGARMMHVYRAVDIGARGVEEYVTAVRWKPFGTVVNDQYARVAIELSNSHVVPDFTVDPWSALPKYPNSGLGAVFASNPKALEVPVRVCDGPYVIRGSDVRQDGYLEWPKVQNAFVYNGVDSLLIDVRAVPGPTTLAANGFRTRLMVLSSPQPDARVFAPSNGGPNVDPFLVTQAAQGDNTYYETQIEFATIRSRAVTRYVPNPGPQRQLQDPYLAGDLPLGSSMVVEFEGALGADGNGAQGYFGPALLASGYPFVRVRVTLSCDPVSGARPSLDTLVIPVD